jgi:hypothetical protein
VLPLAFTIMRWREGGGVEVHCGLSLYE